MIIKLDEKLNWLTFRKKTRTIKAVRMNSDFLFETKSGWVQGYKGQWLIEMGEKIRSNVDNESFERLYRPMGRQK